MATIKDVAKEAGVGVGTASRALSGNGSVSDDARKRINAAVKKLNFVPNQSARNLKNQSCATMAISVPTIRHPFFAKIIYYVEECLSRRGVRMLVVNSQDKKSKESEMLEMIRQARVDGIIFITHHAHDSIDENLPIVSVDRHIGGKVPFVTSNNYEASREAVEYLLSRGAKRVGCVCGKTAVESEVQLRYKAYDDCMREHGLPSRLAVADFKHGDEMEVMREYLQNNPDIDGLFAGSDMLANAAYYNALLLGKRVPEDLQIAGFDGVMDEWCPHPKLTTVQQDIEALAATAVDVLFARVRGEEYEHKTVIKAKLKIGETTK